MKIKLFAPIFFAVLALFVLGLGIHSTAQAAATEISLVTDSSFGSHGPVITSVEMGHDQATWLEISGGDIVTPLLVMYAGSDLLTPTVQLGLDGPICGVGPDTNRCKQMHYNQGYTLKLWGDRNYAPDYGNLLYETWTSTPWLLAYAAANGTWGQNIQVEAMDVFTIAVELFVDQFGGEPVTVTVPYAPAGLFPNESYRFVRSFMTDGVTGEWSGSFVFTGEVDPSGTIGLVFEARQESVNIFTITIGEDYDLAPITVTIGETPRNVGVGYHPLEHIYVTERTEGEPTYVPTITIGGNILTTTWNHGGTNFWSADWPWEAGTCPNVFEFSAPGQYEVSPVSVTQVTTDTFRILGWPCPAPMVTLAGDQMSGLMFSSTLTSTLITEVIWGATGTPTETLVISPGLTWVDVYTNATSIHLAPEVVEVLTTTFVNVGAGWYEIPQPPTQTITIAGNRGMIIFTRELSASYPGDDYVVLGLDGYPVVQLEWVGNTAVLTNTAAGSFFFAPQWSEIVIVGNNIQPLGEGWFAVEWLKVFLPLITKFFFAP